jgi:hypothetical protein
MKYHYKCHDLNQSVGGGVRISMFVLSVVDRGSSLSPVNQRLLNWELLALCERSDFSFRELKRCARQLREVNGD